MSVPGFFTPSTVPVGGLGNDWVDANTPPERVITFTAGLLAQRTITFATSRLAQRVVTFED